MAWQPFVKKLALLEHKQYAKNERSMEAGMLRLTVSTEEYLQIGDDVKIIFLGGSKNHLRIMVDAPKELNVVRSKVIENSAKTEKEKAKLPHYYAVPDLSEKYRKKRIVVNDGAAGQTLPKKATKPNEQRNS